MPPHSHHPTGRGQVVSENVGGSQVILGRSQVMEEVAKDSEVASENMGRSQVMRQLVGSGGGVWNLEFGECPSFNLALALRCLTGQDFSPTSGLGSDRLMGVENSKVKVQNGIPPSLSGSLCVVRCVLRLKSSGSLPSFLLLGGRWWLSGPGAKWSCLEPAEEPFRSYGSCWVRCIARRKRCWPRRTSLRTKIWACCSPGRWPQPRRRWRGFALTLRPSSGPSKPRATPL